MGGTLPSTSRHGYWYGLQVAARAARRADGLADLLTAAPADWRPHLHAYFS